MHQTQRLAAAPLLTLGLTALSASRAHAAPIVANQNFVRQIYSDLLNRPPSAGELAISTQLDNATLTRSQVVATLTSADEFLADQVNAFYQLLLHRLPSSLERNPAVNLLKLGQSFEQAQSNIAGGSEYFTNRAGGTNDGFLDAIFSDELNHAVDPLSRTTYDSLLTGGTTRTQLTGLILASNEYRGDLVHTYYNQFLRRSPLPTDTSSGVGILSTQTDQTYINLLLASDEYFNLAQTVPEPSAAACLIAASLLMTRRRRHAEPKG